VKLPVQNNCGKVNRSRRIFLELLAGVQVLPIALKSAFGQVSNQSSNQSPNQTESQGSDEEKRRPQKGDRLAYDGGAHDGQVITLDQLEINAKPVAAFPMTEANMIRKGSRLNRVLVLRLPEADLSAQTVEFAAQGVVAYSGVCTHTGCDVENWNASTRNLVCPCHGSEFNSLDAAAVAQGPAPQPLALLPLNIVNNELVVAGSFSRRVGFQQQ
jgi:rieske iron-sulfur protein